MAKELPQRSCLGCGSVKDKRELLRFVIAPDRSIVPDLKQKLPGRGAYTCYSDQCLRNAINRRQFSRAFKGDVQGASDQLLEKLRHLFKERILGYMALANKAGRVVSGSDMVLETLRKREKPGVVFVAEDISEEIGSKVRALSESMRVPCFRLAEKERLGDLLGKGTRSVIAIMPSGFVDNILTELDKYRKF